MSLNINTLRPRSNIAPALDLNSRNSTSASSADGSRTYSSAPWSTRAAAARRSYSPRIATTPAHVLEHELGTGRANDIRLAELASAVFQARRAWAPRSGRPATETRELYIAIILRGEHAREPAIVEQLVNLYARADTSAATGYWIVAANCTQSATQLDGYATLALRLQALTQRVAVVSGVGDTHLALLASGVAATCAGLHGMSFKFPPDELPERPPSDEEDEDGLGVHTYHRAVLGNVGQLGDGGEPARIALFNNRPCPCGHHVGDRPPAGKTATVRHNAWSVGSDAYEFSTPNVLEAEARLGRRADDAARQRKFLRLGKLKSGFRGVASAAAAVRARDDDARREDDQQS